MFQPLGQRLRATGPERSLLADPPLRQGKRIRLQGQPVLAPPDLPLDQPCRLQHADVARHPGEGHGQRGRQIGDTRLAIAQRDQQRPPGRVGQCGIGAVQHQIFNHLVDLTARP